MGLTVLFHEETLNPGEFRSGTRLAPVFRTQQILSSVFGYASPIAKNWRANVRSIVAARAWSALAARFALTNSSRFCFADSPPG